MGELPQWWLILTAVFCVLGILLFLGLTILSIVLLNVVRKLSKRIETIGDKVDAITTQVKEVTHSVGGRAKNIAERVDIVTAKVAQNFSTIATVLLAGATILKLRRMMKEQGNDGE